MNPQAILVDSVDISQKQFCKDVVKSKSDYCGTLLILNNNMVKKLNQLPLGKERVDYIKNIKPINCFLIFCTTSGTTLSTSTSSVCRIHFLKDDLNHLDLAIEHIKTNIKPNVIWVCIPLQSKHFDNHISLLINLKFQHPYITDKTPCDQSMKHSMAMSVHLNEKEKESQDVINVQNAVKYALEQYKNNECKIECKFDDEAIKFLQQASDMGHTKGIQKEITGKLYVKKVNLVFVIGVDKKIEIGEEESVSIAPSRYNFHSHPREAYVRHSVKNAWPSLTDYLGFLQLGNNTIFHCVAGLEGVYIMSFGSHWVSKLKKIDKKFISDHYDFTKERNTESPLEYTKKINSILYHGYPIFNVKFLPWEMCNTIFSVFYNKHGLNCFTSDKIIKVVEDIHSSSSSSEEKD